VNRPPIVERVYAALVRLYPRQFRDDYGTDMMRLFHEQLRDGPRVRVCWRTTLDLILTVPHQHLEVHMKRDPTPALLLVYLAVALVGVVVAVVGGSSAPALVVGAALVASGGALAIATWRRAAPFQGSGLSAQWWKFVVAGPVLLGSVVVAAGFGVEAWFLGMAVIIAAFGLVGIGVVLAVVRLTGRRHPRPA
jgi:hypothetical protein